MLDLYFAWLNEFRFININNPKIARPLEQFKLKALKIKEVNQV